MKKLLLTALIAATAVMPAFAVKGTVKTAQDQKSGEIVWQNRSKKYMVTFKRGTADIQAEYPLADVVSIDVPKPANLDQCIASKNIAGLKRIMEDYRMLTWDKPAARALVNAYLTASPANPQEAYNVARKLIEDDEKSAYLGDLAPAYWRALFALGKTQQLENCLRKATQEGDRVSSAEALIMRGDMIAQPDTPQAHRQALIDGYLRVALMYGEPECNAVRADAMNRAATSFGKIGMNTRAEQMRSEARQLK